MFGFLKHHVFTKAGKCAILMSLNGLYAVRAGRLRSGLPIPLCGKKKKDRRKEEKAMTQKTSVRSALRGTLIGDRAFYRRVLMIVLPIIVQNTVSNVVNLLDNVMVGRVGTLEMSAVAIVNQLFFVFNLCIFGGLAGAGIFATQYAGAQDHDGVRDCFRMKCWISLVMLCAALAIFLLMPGTLIRAYLAEGTAPLEAERTLGFGLQYLYVMLFGLLPFAVSQVYASTLREVGETALPMLASVAAILVNLLFNYLLIFGSLGFPKWGVVGAAVATVLSRYVEMTIIVVYTHVKANRFPFIQGAYRTLRVPRALLFSIVRKGMPLLVNEFLWSSGMAMLLQCYSVRGLQVVAAQNISSTVANLFNVVFLSMGSAVSIMVGQALGAGHIEEAKRTAWRLIVVSVASTLVMSALMHIFAPMIPHIYNTEAEVRQMATQFLRVVAIIMPLNAFSHCCYFTLRSGGRTWITFLFDSLFTWGVSIPTAWALANLTAMPVVELFFCVQALEVIKLVIGFILLRMGVWARNIVSAQTAPEAVC